jgi:hypothetical protein
MPFTLFVAKVIARAANYSTTFGMIYRHIGGGTTLEIFMLGIYGQLCDLSKYGMIRWIWPSLQFVLKMQSQWRELIPLTGEIMNEGEHMSYAIAANHRVLMMIVWVYKAMMAFHFGFYSVAEEIYKDMGGITSVFRLHFSATPMYLYAGMTHFGRYRETGKWAKTLIPT